MHQPDAAHPGQRDGERGGERSRQGLAGADGERPSVRQGGRQGQLRIGGYFQAPEREQAPQLYRQYYPGTRCPPGLARKGNGCLPPGLARAYVVGRPLPPQVIFYDLPPRLVVELGLPPPGYRYVRVAADILLIAVGTGLVIDALQDLAR
jgi:hypothetical protein